MKSISSLAKVFHTICDILGFIFEKVVTILFAVILLGVAPFLVVTSIPYFICRHALNKLGRKLKPTLGAMVTARGSIFAIDAFYHRKKPLVSIVVQSRLVDRLPPSRLRAIIEERILYAKETNGSGNLKFPELRQFLTVWCGFFFWEWDSTFNLDDHLKHHRLESQLDADGKNEALSKFHEDLLQRPWTKNKPLWEIWIVDVDDTQNNNSDQSFDKMPIKTTSTLFLRTSHCLVDGYSLLYLVSEYFSESGNPPDHAMPIPAYRPLWRKALFCLMFPFRAALESSSIFAKRINPFTILPFQVPYKSQAKAPMHLVSTKSLSVSRIKRIKHHFQVSFTSVVNATLAGGIRELMLSKGIGHPPVDFPLLIPLPLRGHPGAGLRNYMGGAIAYLHTRGRDPVTRLRAADQDVTRLKRSTFPLLSFIGVKTIGCAPAWVLHLFCRNWFTTSLLTSFPGGNSPLDVGGLEVKELRVGIGLFTGQTGLAFVALSYQDDLWISVTGDGSLFTKEDIKVLIAACEAQIDLLYEQINESV